MTSTAQNPRSALLIAQLANLRANLARMQRLWEDFARALGDAASRLPVDRTGVGWVRAQLQLVRDARNRMDDLRKDYRGLLVVSILDAAQGSAEREDAEEQAAGLKPDPRLAPSIRHTVTLSDGAVLTAIYSIAAARAAKETMERVYPDGLRLYDRLTNLDTITRGVVDQVIAEGIAKGLSASEIAARLKLALTEAGIDTPLYKAMRLAVTETSMAAREASIRSATDGEGKLKPGIMGLRWTLSAAHAVADECDTYAAESSDGLPSGVYLPEDVPQSHPNCFPAGTVTIAPNVQSSMMRWYDGEIVDIQTVGGNSIAVTPNHPILTSKGWVAAALLSEGGNVISCRIGEAVASLVDPNNEHIPSLIEDIAESVGRSVSVTSGAVPITSEDFHGDGIDGQICIVRTDGFMRDIRNTSLTKPLTDQQFVSGTDGLLSFNASRSFAQIRESAGTSSNRIVGGGRIREPLFGRESCIPNELSVTHSSDSNFVHFQESANDPSTDSKFLGQCEFASSALVEVANLLVAPDEMIDSSRASGLRNSIARLLFVDRIATVRKRYFQGHVYNLQTQQGWYITGNIIAHNCQCALEPVFAGATE